MKATVHSLQGKKVSEIDLDEGIFGLPARADILHRMVQWQLAKRQAGTHKTKGISEISGTTRKPYKQKGTGSARQGSLRSPQFRGGATIFGPVVRSHAIDLTKKFRKLGLKTALSAKLAEGKLTIVDSLDVKEAKTKSVAEIFEKQGLSSVLVIDGTELSANFAQAASNLKGVDVLPQQGANVYDILRHRQLILTTAAVQDLQARLK